VQALLREGGVMAEFRSLLRRFDDCPPQYHYSTIGRGDDTVQQPYLALLASMTPADLRVAAARGALLWNDGFWARFIFVTPPADSEGVRSFPEGKREISPDLVIPLREWHERLGMPLLRLEKKGKEYRLERGPLPRHVCVMGEGVRAALDRYDEAMRRLLIASGTTDQDGNYSRLPEKALRVAALVASLENEGRIEMRHWALAQGIAEAWREDLHELYEQVTAPAEPDSARVEEAILRFVQKLGQPTPREVAQRVHKLTTAEAREQLEALAQAGVLEQVRDGKKMRYRLAPEQ
jgi:DNA-binding transcriptional ArsR family regulator